MTSATTLEDLRNEARRRLAAGQLVASLKVYRLVLQAVPYDFTLRFEIADILKAAGMKRHATAVYQSIAVYNVRIGEPLAALVAIKILELMGEDIRPLLQQLAATYASDSKILGRGIKPAPVDYDLPVREDIDLNYAIDDGLLVKDLAASASDISGIRAYPSIVPPIAILSTLERDPFARLVASMTLKRHKDEDVVVREGATGTAVYFIARGEVRVTRMGDKGECVALARLGPGSIFGEMALISAEPRGATVTCDGGADLFELTRAQVEQISNDIPVIGNAMARFTRDRLIANLLATNPLFTPFNEKAKKELLTRFSGHEIPAGTIFIEQGKPGTGLYILLQGTAEVLTWNGDAYVKVADVKAGDVVGEISLIHSEPATATVRSTARATVLFLAKELFMPLVEAVPELLTHFARMANSRLTDTATKLKDARLLHDDNIESVEDSDDDVDELDSDDLVLL